LPAPKRLDAPEAPMPDLLHLLLGIAGFAACWGFLMLCDGL
jgi:hypothetical protein